MNITQRQKAYVDAVEASGLGANASFGLCPGCGQCADDCGFQDDDYRVEPEGPFKPTAADRYHATLMGDLMVSTSWADGWALGLVPTSEIVAGIVADVKAEGAGQRAYDAAYETGKVEDEGGFSFCGCGICGCHLGNTLYTYHWIDNDGNICHDTDGCPDCLFFFANGDLPADEYLGWTGEPADTESEVA